MRDVADQLPMIGASGGTATGYPDHGRGIHSLGVRTGDALKAPLKAPFPWFGGKSRVATSVWERFGDVANYVEPFFGSGAVLFGRPHEPRIETVNDLDCYVANFWRACAWPGADAEERRAAVAEEVARWCDWPVNEADLHARHRWLVGQADFRERMRRDPEYFDARIAGWWVWGLCAWIGSGWCSIEQTSGGKLPNIGGRRAGDNMSGGTSGDGVGVHAKAMREPSEQLPRIGGSAGGGRGRPEYGQGVHAAGMREPSEQLPMLGGGQGEGDACRSRGVHSGPMRSALYDTFARLAARLRYVRVACGDWRRVLTDSVTWRHGTTAVFLDPPYGDDADRAGDLYAHDSGTVAADVRAWCVEHGGDKRLRIALCGYAGEGHEELEALGWSVEAWKAKGGYGGQRKDGENENAARERIWCSPGCLAARQRTIFDMLAEAR